MTSKLNEPDGPRAVNTAHTERIIIAMPEEELHPRDGSWYNPKQGTLKGFPLVLGALERSPHLLKHMAWEWVDHPRPQVVKDSLGERLLSRLCHRAPSILAPLESQRKKCPLKMSSHLKVMKPVRKPSPQRVTRCTCDEFLIEEFEHRHYETCSCISLRSFE